VKIRRVLSKDIQRIVENYFSVAILNGVNYIFPLLLIPYLTSVLGVGGYGKYAFSLAVLQYLSIIINYGFNYSATKDIAIYKGDELKVIEIFSEVIWTKLALTLFCVLILTIGLLVFGADAEMLWIYWGGIGMLIGHAITPIWFFQGIEKMRNITVVSFVTKLIGFLLVIIVVKQPEDLKYVNFLQSTGFLAGGLVALWISYLSGIRKFHAIYIEGLKKQLGKGWQIFISTLGMNFYRESNVIILGIVTSYDTVGLYAAAEKMIKAIQSFVNPMAQAAYPYFSRKVESDKATSINILMKVTGVVCVALTVCVAVLFSLSDILISSFLPEEYLKSITNFNLMLPVIVFGAVNYFLGIVGLINLGKESSFTYSVLRVGLLSIVLCYLLSLFYYDIGASVTMVIVELLLSLQLFYYLRKFKAELNG